MEIFVPYRICPLGAHVDHQNGIVMGTTLRGKGVYLNWEHNKTGKVTLYSENYRQAVEFDMNDIPPSSGTWHDYAKGACSVLKKCGRLGRGIKGRVRTNFPGGGLSSSAAVSIAYIAAIMQANNIKITVGEKIELVREIENGYIGLKSGVLDQSVILLGNREHVKMLLLDCLDMKRQYISNRKGFEVAIVYSGVEKPVIETGYNRRVNECEEAAKKLLAYEENRFGEDKRSVKLREVSERTFIQFKDRLPLNLRKRAEHFFSESERVKKGAEFWKQGDMENFGKLVTESGASSIKNYECGSPPLIKIFDILKDINGVYGTRFSGAGFRGSCIALIEPSDTVKDNIKDGMNRFYSPAFPEYADKMQICFCETGSS